MHILCIYAHIYIEVGTSAPCPRGPRRAEGSSLKRSAVMARISSYKSANLITPFMVSYNPIYSDLHLLKGFNCGMIELLQGFSMAKGLVFGHSQKKRDKP